jgi:predicted amino acid-binding ACT domain protein
VLGDLLTAARHRVRNEIDVPFSVDDTLVAFPHGELQTAVYLTLNVLDRPGVLAAVAGVFGEHDVSIESMWQSGIGNEARLTFVTHLAFESDIAATLEDLRALDVVDRVGSCIQIDWRAVSRWKGLLHEYADWFDLSAASEVVTLLEGNTPLLHAERLSERLGADIWLKLEGLNPTGSFKDRGMTMAITKAKAQGSKTVVCGSTGNTSAAAAAFAARAGMGCVVLVPEGKIALGKLAQAIVYGADVVQIRGNFDRALNLASRTHAAPAHHDRELHQSRSHRGSKDRGLRTRRCFRRGPGHFGDPRRQRW